MPRYSLVLFVYEVKLQIEFAEPNGYGTLSNSELVNCLAPEAATACKTQLRNPKKGAQS